MRQTKRRPKLFLYFSIKCNLKSEEKTIKQFKKYETNCPLMMVFQNNFTVLGSGQHSQKTGNQKLFLCFSMKCNLKSKEKPTKQFTKILNLSNCYDLVNCIKTNCSLILAFQKNFTFWKNWKK